MFVLMISLGCNEYHILGPCAFSGWFLDPLMHKSGCTMHFHCNFSTLHWTLQNMNLWLSSAQYLVTSQSWRDCISCCWISHFIKANFAPFLFSSPSDIQYLSKISLLKFVTPLDHWFIFRTQICGWNWSRSQNICYENVSYNCLTSSEPMKPQLKMTLFWFNMFSRGCTIFFTCSDIDCGIKKSDKTATFKLLSKYLYLEG